MATGDKIFLADKQTLDDVNSKVGAPNNTGGTASAGTVFGKLNAIISNFATHVAAWTAARAAKVDNLDTSVSSRQSEANALTRYNQLNTNTGVNNTASATGTLSQKLSHIINLFSNNKQKVLVSKVVNIELATAGTHTLVNVTGGGQFEIAHVTGMGYSYAPITFEIDGIPYVFNKILNPSFISHYGAGVVLGDTTSVQTSIRPLHFKNSLKITVAASNQNQLQFSASYSVYE